MVVDDVEDHRQAGFVGRFDQPLEALGRRRRMGGAQVDAVVAPAASPRELGDRHHLDRGDSQLRQRRQVRDRAVERSLRAELPTWSS